jgi:hypothetical protein
MGCDAPLAGFPTNPGAQPLVDVGRSFSLLNSLRFQFSIMTVARYIAGDFFELDRGFRVLIIRRLLNHLDAFICAIAGT